MRLTHLSIRALAGAAFLCLSHFMPEGHVLRRGVEPDSRLAAEAALAYERERPVLDRFEGGAP